MKEIKIKIETSIKGYMCKFCYYTNTDKDVIEYHETICECNPKNKSCYSCGNQWQNSDAGDSVGCKIKLPTFTGDITKHVKSISNCSGWIVNKGIKLIKPDNFTGIL